MKQFFPGPLSNNARNLMRALGYGEHRGHGDQLSYARRISGAPFPRYHAYVEDRDGGVQVNLHIDQKEASYHGTSAHAGEYEGPLVQEEMRRIVAFIATPVQRQPAASPTTPSKKGFWGILFG